MIAPDRRTGVYRCFDEDGTLLYVGQSVNPRSRIADHKRSKLPRSEWTDSLHHWTVEWFPTSDEALQAEGKAIYEEEPLANYQASGGHERWLLEAACAAMGHGAAY